MTVTSLDILASMTGVAQGNLNGSADKRIKQARIDPAFVASSFLTGTLPKVTFEGETTLSAKFYAVASPYWPHPNDRVWMVPIGTTYLIAGSIEPSQASVYVGKNLYIPGVRTRVNQNIINVNSANITVITTVQTLIANVITGRWYEVGWYGNVGLDQGSGQTVSSYVNTVRLNGGNIRRLRSPTTGGSNSSIYGFNVKLEFQATTTGPLTFTGLLERAGTGNVFLSVPTPDEVVVMYLDYVRG